MLYKKEGFPNEGEIVKCTVTSVQYHSVFVKLDEYDKSGMIHISEISPGRIRNIRDYVSEGKVIICKVLRVRMDRGHIDLSLRRVNESQKRKKINDLKDEQKAEKIIEFVATKLKTTKSELFEKIKDKIFNVDERVYPVFEHVLIENDYLIQIGIEKKIADQLKELIIDRIKPPIVEISRKIKINSYEPNGVEIIKKYLITVDNLSYLGGGRYMITLQDEDYKSAEKNINVILDKLEKNFKGTKTIVEIEK